MANCRLNWIEPSVTAKLADTWAPSKTEWKPKSVAYAASHKTPGKEYAYKTVVIQNQNTYGNTPKIVKKITRVYSKRYNAGTAKKPKWRQKYREHTVITMTGFLSCIDPAKIKTGVDLNKNIVYVDCIYPTKTKKMRFPTAINYSYEDVDVETVDKQKQISSLSRNTSGFIKRNRVRKDLVTLGLEWDYLTAAETKTIMELLSKSQYLRVSYYDPVLGRNAYRCMFCNQKSVSAAYNGNFQEIKAELVQV